MPKFYKSIGEFRRRAWRDPSTYLGGALLVGAILAIFFANSVQWAEYEERVKHIVPIGLALMGGYNLWRRGGGGDSGPSDGPPGPQS